MVQRPGIGRNDFFLGLAGLVQSPQCRRKRAAVQSISALSVVISRKSLFLAVWQKPLDLLRVPGIYEGFSSEVSFPLGGLAREDVAVIGLFPLDLPTLQDGESLGRATVAFHFRHLQLSSSCGGQRASNRNQTILNFFLYRICSGETNNFFRQRYYSVRPRAELLSNYAITNPSKQSPDFQELRVVRGFAMTESYSLEQHSVLMPNSAFPELSTV